MGSSSGDIELVAQKFGYPELFPDDEQVNEAFGINQSEETIAED